MNTPPGIEIKPDVLYSERELRLLGLDGDGLSRARRTGQLRAKQIGTCWHYLGTWLLEWLRKEDPVRV